MKRNLDSYFKKYAWAIALYIFLNIAGSACSVFITILSADMVEQITFELYQKAIHSALFIMLLLIVARIFWWICSYIYAKYSSKIMMDLNYDLSRQAFKLNSKTYSDHNTGTFVQRIVGDPQVLVNNLAGIVEIAIDIVSYLVIFIYVATLNIWISLSLIILIVISGTLEFYRVRVLRKNRKTLRAQNDKVRSLTTEIVKSEKDIKSMGLEEKLSETSKEYYENLQNLNFKATKTNSNLRQIRTLIINLGIVATLILGIVLMQKALIGIATFMIVYSNKGSVFSIVNGVGNIGNMWADIKVSTERMFALFDEEEFVTEKFGALNLDNVSQIGGEIEFDNVGYTYREYQYSDKTKLKKGQKAEVKTISENHIFENLSFKIQPNTTVAFVGKSGSGKSTILNLMSKLFEAESGRVLIDGTNINDLSKDSLRRTISLVNQFPYIFDMSIKDNLLLAKSDATDEEIDNAIKNSCLDEFVSTLPLGLYTKVGESGIKLSGGQKQRVAIARALLRNSPIIIFDESTSSLDNFAQTEIKKSIDNLKGKSTVVIVAHRLSTIKDVDKIFFLDEGKIVDTGTFDELFNRNEKFKAMFLAENI
ncbi:MAG: ABC transporter ATP-binding protein [Candidatus Caccovivens sp.]